MSFPNSTLFNVIHSSRDFISFQPKLKLDVGKETEELETIREYPDVNKQNLKKIMSDNQNFIDGIQLKDDYLLEGAHQCTYLVSSLFMPFLFSFIKDEKKLVHWPVAGPVNFNCRIIKHEIINELNTKIMSTKLHTNELSYVVPYKMDAVSDENSRDGESSKMSSLFSDTCQERPELKNLCAVFLESSDFIPLFKLLYVSFCLNFFKLLIPQPSNKFHRQGDDFDIESLFNSRDVKTESHKVLISTHVLMKTIEGSSQAQRAPVPTRLCRMYRSFLGLRCKSDEDLKKLLTSNSFLPKNINQLILLITTTFLSLHKIRLSFIEGQKRITCYRFTLFGRKTCTENFLGHNDHFLWSQWPDPGMSKFRQALNNYGGTVYHQLYYHKTYRDGMSNDAAMLYKKVSSKSALSKEEAEKLSWDNLFSSILTNYENDLINALGSPDQDGCRNNISRELSGSNGSKYFSLKDDRTEDGVFSSNVIIRYHLCNTNFMLNQKIFSDVPVTLRSLSSSLKKNDLATAQSSAENYAKHFHSHYKSSIWCLSTKDYSSMPCPRIQPMFCRLIQEGSFANFCSIQNFFDRFKFLFQLNTIPRVTMNLLRGYGKEEFLELHNHHIDDIYDEGSISPENTPMVGSLRICLFQEI